MASNRSAGAAGPVEETLALLTYELEQEVQSAIDQLPDAKMRVAAHQLVTEAVVRVWARRSLPVQPLP